ncbi:EAL domain-containing protein [Cedecea neteri]|uniref:EAL domain-containing protein n=1 Tax=Cedecea neteri TaxID=158822 RepID=UPI002893030C|nr:EAL domain-containing protein [Cedecea neteri]WNJ78499.1 EAL domain-containing protein [Cedecea neteri]
MFKYVIEPYSQPITDCNTGCIIGFEILLKVTKETPIKNYLSPDSLLHTFKSTIEYNHLTICLMHHVNERIEELTEKLPDNGFISFNIIAEQLLSASFVKYLISFRKKIRQDIKLVLELVDNNRSSLTDDIINTISTLSKHNIEIAIDDFSNNSISIKYIEAMRFYMLKLGRELSLTHNNTLIYESTIKSLVYLTSLVNTILVVEGVETKLQKDLLLNCGVNYMQGYYFGAPTSM